MLQRPQSRRGATTITMTVLLSLVCAILMLVVELGRIQVVKSEIQNAVDAGALAGALKFRQDSSDIHGAIDEAERYVQLNHVGIAELIPEDSILAQTGLWDASQETFTPTTIAPNSIRVQATRQNEPFFLASLFGKTDFSVPASAIVAIGNGPLDVMLTVDMAESMGNNGKIEALQTTLPFFVDLFEGLGGDDQIGMMGFAANPSIYNPVAKGHTGVLYTSAMSSSSGDDFVGVLEGSLTKNFSAFKNSVLNSNVLTADKYGSSSSLFKHPRRIVKNRKRHKDKVFTSTISSNPTNPVDSARRFSHSLRDSADYLFNGSAARTGARKVIVLISDGNPSAPGSSAFSSMTLSAETTQCRVFVISVGDNANTSAMQDLADASGGEHFEAMGANEAELVESLKTAFGQVTSAVKASSMVK